MQATGFFAPFGVVSRIAVFTTKNRPRLQFPLHGDPAFHLTEIRMTARSKHRVVMTLFVGAVFALPPVSAWAQNAQQACAGDIKTYCASVPQGEGRVAQCLRSHKDQLSPGCQRGMTQATALMKEVVQACEDDLHRYCAGAAPGTAKECLRTNFRELSLGCKRELFEAKKGT